MNFRLTVRRAFLLGLIFAGPIAACGSKGSGLTGIDDTGGNGNGSTNASSSGGGSGFGNVGGSSSGTSAGGSGTFKSSDGGAAMTTLLTADAACAFSTQMG